MPREGRVGSTPTSPTSRGRAAASRGRPRTAGGPALYFPGDACHRHPAPKSSVLLEIELPPERSTAPSDGPSAPCRRRTQVAGLPAGQGAAAGARAGPRARRPSSTRRSSTSSRRLPRRARRAGHPAARPTPTSRSSRPRRASPLVFTATVQVRPEVELGDYKQLQLQPRDRDDRRRQGRPGHRRAARPERDADRGRGSRRAERRLRGHRLRRDARRRAVRGRHVRADAAHPRRGAADPGLRGPPRRARGRRLDRVRHHLPGRLPAEATWPASRPTSRSSCGSCARRSCPSSTTTSPARWATSPTSTRCGPTSRRASSATPSTGPATGSPTGSSSTRSPTRRSSCPTSSSTRRSRSCTTSSAATLARQGITEEAYLKAIDKTEADLHAEFRPRAEKRVKTLLVLSKIADAEGVDGDRRRRRGRGRPRPRALRATIPGCIAYFDSERGRAYIRSTLRRSRVVEGLVDDWLAAHPGPRRRCRTSRTGRTSAVEGGQAAANASIDATDPGSVLEDVPAAAG